MKWTSLKNKWPDKPSEKIEVWDCKNNVFGKAWFDGWDFFNIEWDNPLKGSLMLVHYQVTHWR